MNTQTEKNIQRIVVTAAALVFIGVGLNILVMQTLGSFDAASVILALFLAFWAFVLGNAVLILSSVWLVISRMLTASKRMSGNQQSPEHAPFGVEAICH
jgi:hypothetical protein